MDKKFVLIEVIEREIGEPEFFNTYEEAYGQMKKYYHEAAASGCEEDEGLDGELNQWDAWCENANHDNCDWEIFELNPIVKQECTDEWRNRRFL